MREAEKHMRIYLKRAVVLALVWLSLCSPARAALEYEVERQGTTFHVVLSFPVNAARTRLDLPSRWAGQEHLERQILNLQVVSPSEAHLSPGDKPERTWVECPPGRTVQVSYDIVQDFSDRIDSDNVFRVLSQAAYFHSMGEAFWVFPCPPDDRPLDFRIRWHLPSDWAIANSFGVNQREQNFRATMSQFRGGIYVAGDFRLHSLQVRGNPLWVGVRGRWKFGDEHPGTRLPPQGGQRKPSDDEEHGGEQPSGVYRKSRGCRPAAPLWPEND